jgi:hypothetical protein
MVNGLTNNLFLDMIGVYNKVERNQNRIEGLIELNPLSREIGGNISYYGKRIRPTHKIRGHLKQDSGITKLVFLNFIPEETKALPGKLIGGLLAPEDSYSNYSSHLFQLEGKVGDSFEGEYHGKWFELSYVMQFREDYHLFIAQIDLGKITASGNLDVSLTV